MSSAIKLNMEKQQNKVEPNKKEKKNKPFRIKDVPFKFEKCIIFYSLNSVQ